MFSLCATKKEVEKIQTVKYVMDNIKNARFFIELTKFINKIDKKEEFDSFGVFEIENPKSKSFFMSLVNESFNNYIPFLSSVDEGYLGSNLLLLEKRYIKIFTRVLKSDDGGDKEWAIFELHFALKSYGFNQGMTIGVHRATLSLDFLESLLNEYKSNDGLNKDLVDFIEYIINDLKNGNYSFAFLPYGASTHYRLSFKICGRYPPCVKILTKPEDYTVSLERFESIDYKKYIEKYRNKIRIFDYTELEDKEPYSLIYKILHDLLSRYIKANGLVDLVIDNFSEDYNGVLDITPSKSNKLLNRLISNMYKKCFPVPGEKCPKLNSYKGKFIRLETLFRSGHYSISGYAPDLRGYQNMIFLIVLEVKYNSKKLEIVKLNLEWHFFYCIKIYGEDFKKDIIDVMKILGILENEIDLLILERVVKYGFID